MPTITELADSYAAKNRYVKDETDKLLSELDNIGTEIPTKDQIQEARYLLNEYKKQGMLTPEVEAELNGIINFGQQAQPLLSPQIADADKPQVFNKPPSPVLTAQMDAPIVRYKPVGDTEMPSFGKVPTPVLTAQMDAPMFNEEQLTGEIAANRSELDYLKKYNNQQASEIADSLVPKVNVEQPSVKPRYIAEAVIKPKPAKKYKSANFAKGATRL